MTDLIAMKILTNVILLATVITSTTCNKCHACFDGICYSRNRIINENSFSGQLAIDRSDNIVYFHYTDKHSVDHTEGFDLDDVRSIIIPDIGFSFARAVDQATRDVYISGARGIYKHIPMENSTKPLALLDSTIWSMQFKNKLYYNIFKTKGLFIIQNKQSRPVNPLSEFLIDDFVIDNREDIYFLSGDKIYRLKNGGKSALLFANDSYSLAIDKDEVVHFMQSGRRGLYKLDEATDSLIDVGAFGIGSPLRFVFDNNNNVIFHEHHSRKLYYLMPNYNRCKVSYFRTSSNFKKSLRKHGDVGLNSNILVFSQVS